MITIDHTHGRAVMSAVYLADNKHTVGKQMTAETEDHNVPSSNTRRYTPEALGFWQADKGKVRETRKGKVRKRANATEGKKGRGLMGCHHSIHS